MDEAVRYPSADKKGKLTKQEETFYLIDMAYRIQEGHLEEQQLSGQLPAEMLEKTPFLVARRLSTECAFDLGQIWLDCVKQEHGLRRVKSADVNWSQATSYMMEFPEVAAAVFDRLPKLRVILMPMRTRLLPAGQDVCWVGAVSKAKAKLAEAEVRLKPHIKVNLKFD